jgi:phage protein D
MANPTARIELNGKDKTAEWSKVLESLTITDMAGVESDTCEVSFDNADGFRAPPIGAELKVWLGYEPAPVYMGRYKVESWTKEGEPKRLSISATAADLTGPMRARKLRSFHEKTLKEIVDDVAKSNGLTAQVDEAIGARKVEHIDQQTESDIGFLTRLAKRNGATFKVADGQVIFAAKGSRKLPSGKDKTVIELKPQGQSHWTATFGAREDYVAASASYRDSATQRRRTEKAGEGSVVHRDRRLYGSAVEAAAAAEANLGDLRRGTTTVTIEMLGEVSLFAEALVALKDFDPDVDGSYLASSVTHTFNSSGFTTNVSLETDGRK